MSSSTLNSMRIAFIGAGNMANSLIGGLIAKGVKPTQISASEPYEATRNAVRAQYNIAISDNNRDAVANAEVVVLAVKPQVMKQVAQELAPALANKPVLVISIAAGISLDSLQRWLGATTAIVRCMPNTPALMQLGATGMFANAHVSQPQKMLAQQILDAVGISLWLNSEKELDAVTAVSGSGPAYYFLLMEAMINAGIAQGLTPQTKTIDVADCAWRSNNGSALNR